MTNSTQKIEGIDYLDNPCERCRNGELLKCSEPCSRFKDGHDHECPDCGRVRKLYKVSVEEVKGWVMSKGTN